MLNIALIGLFLTLYTIYVERKKSSDVDYKAVCDLNNKFSCSEVVRSDYAKLIGMVFKLDKNHRFNVSNTYLGALFYFAVVLYNFFPFNLIPFKEQMLLVASVLSLMLCFILAYIMHFKLGKYCLVCIMTYFVNGHIFYFALKEAEFI